MSETNRSEKARLSFVIPTYNEELNVIPICDAIIAELTKSLPQYDYEIILIDNDSKDQTRKLIAELCRKNPNIKGIFNAKNFGVENSMFHGLCQTTGDCTILVSADFQDPIEIIPQLIREWEAGSKIVSAIKTTSKENKLIRLLRTCYYKLIKKMSDVEQIEHFTGFGLYDKTFINVLRQLDDPNPFLRGIVAELGFQRKDVPYEQQKRRAGKSSFNWYRYYDLAMLSFTSYTKVGMRLATILGFIISLFSIAIGLIYLILKLTNWNAFPMGSAPILIGVFILGGLQIFFIGLAGEYILSINNRVLRHPLVIEERRINFDNEI